MTSVILPKSSLIDLIDEELYTVPNSPLLNHGSPVYNPLLFQNTNFMSNLSSSALNLTSSGSGSSSGLGPGLPGSGTGSDSNVTNSNVQNTSVHLNSGSSGSSGSNTTEARDSSTPIPTVSNPRTPSASPVSTPKQKSLFTFNNLNDPENYQRIFNDYSSQRQSFIQPNKLLKSNDDAIDVTTQSQELNFNYTPESYTPNTVFNDSNSFNVFNQKSKGQTMKIKTLSPLKSAKFDDLVDPNVEPSHSIKLNFDDHDSIFINGNDSQYHTQYNEDLIDYNYEYELDELSEYESDNDDDCFDHYDDDNEFPKDIYLPEPYNKDFYGMVELNVSNLDINDVEMNDNVIQEDLGDLNVDDIDMDVDVDVDMDDSHDHSDNSLQTPDLSDLSESPPPKKPYKKSKSLDTDDKKSKKKYDEMIDHHCNLINPNTGSPCNKQFSRPYDLIRHQETIHASKKKIFRCVICEGRFDGGKGNGKSKTFSRGDALSRHIKVKHQLVGQEALDMINDAKENVEYVSVL